MTLHPITLNFLIYKENFIFFFISVGTKKRGEGGGRSCSVSFFDNVVLSFHENLLQIISQQSQTTLQPFFASLYIVLHIWIFLEFTKITLTGNLKRWDLVGCYCGANTVPFIFRPSLYVFRVFLFARCSVKTIYKNIDANCLLCYNLDSTFKKRDKKLFCS